MAALEAGKPSVVLASGYSEAGARVTLSHSRSMTGLGKVNSAFYKRYGITQVSTIPEFLETLKFLSICKPVKSRSIATISCSGGEAAMMADHCDRVGLKFSEFSSEQADALSEVLGGRVVISNPLDYHTYIWGDQEKVKHCFKTVYEGTQAITVMAFDYPGEGVCDTAEWDMTIQAIIDARNETGATVTVMASLHENLPESVQLRLANNGIAPILGLHECFNAILS